MDASELQGDLLEPKPPAEKPSEPSEIDFLWAQIYRLQTVLAVALVALVFLSFAVILYLGKQTRDLSLRRDESRKTANELFQEFNSKQAPLLRSFILDCQYYASTNQEFAPFLEKYRSALRPFFTPSGPAATNLLPAAEAVTNLSPPAPASAQ